MKLLKILLEQSGKPKALIMAGSGGAGKSYILNQLGKTNLPILNPDTYVERDNLPLATASAKVSKEIEELIAAKKSFIWDTTAGNPRKVEQIIEAGYDVAMVMVYTHPIVAFLSNFDRKERSLPKSAVFSTWKATYSLMEYYEQLLGDNFFLIENTRADKFGKEIRDFNQAAAKGSKGIEQYIDNLMSSNPDKFTSTYRKPFEIEDKEALAAYEREMADVDYDKNDESMVKALKKHFMGFWEKGKTPPKGSMQTKVNAVLRTAAADKEQAEEVANQISSMVNDRNLQDKIQASSSVEKVRAQIQNFLAR